MPQHARLVIALTIYSRPGCHLCDDMKALVDRVVRAIPEPVTIDVVDISADVDLTERYGLEIPVLLVNGKKAAKVRVREEDLRRLLTASGAE